MQVILTLALLIAFYLLYKNLIFRVFVYKDRTYYDLLYMLSGIAGVAIGLWAIWSQV